ncbi:hypothetical protein KCU73_g7319, partial [Aureobasidium melanogenum]
MNYSWDQETIDRIIGLINSMRTDFPGYSVTMSVGRRPSTTTPQTSSTQVEETLIHQRKPLQGNRLINQKRLHHILHKPVNYLLKRNLLAELSRSLR